jgi:hypothetical protein
MPLGSSGPYAVQDIFNAIFTSGTAPSLRMGINNYEEIAFASTLWVGTATSTAMVNTGARGMAIFSNITTGSASGTIGTIEVQALVSSGTYQTIYSLTSAGYTTGTAAFLIYPGAASAGGWTMAPIQGVVPRNYRLRVLPSFATATMGYNVTVSYIF